MLEKLLGTTPAERSLSIIRIAVALMLIIHGIARLSMGIVDDFGGFLSSVGFPLGGFIAWTITIVEIAGGAMLGLGKFKLPFALYFSIQLVAGIILVHGSEGWFVVGAGRNGMEFSVLLIVCLMAIAYQAKPQSTSD